MNISKQDENKTPSTIRRNSALKVKKKDDENVNSKANLHNSIDSMNFDENNNKRRCKQEKR